MSVGLIIGLAFLVFVGVTILRVYALCRKAINGLYSA